MTVLLLPTGMRWSMATMATMAMVAMATPS